MEPEVTLYGKQVQSEELQKHIANFLAEGGEIVVCPAALGAAPPTSSAQSPNSWRHKEEGVRPYLGYSRKLGRLQKLARAYAAQDIVIRAAVKLVEKETSEDAPECAWNLVERAKYWRDSIALRLARRKLDAMVA